MYTTIIRSAALALNISNPNWVIVDCRFVSGDLEAGRQMYLDAHIPSAVYVHVADDLNGPPLTDAGRSPLPSPEKMREVFGRIGITPKTQVIIYDQVGGVYAGRLWWMLRYMGHEGVAILDGGWPQWTNGNHPTASGEETNAAVTFVGEPNREMLVVLDEVTEQPLLIDSRGADRYAGKVEPLDKRAGHIPGAKNYHFPQNWTGEEKLMKSPDELKAQFAELFGDVPSKDVTFYCGSGVSANVNIIAVARAGLPLPKLYVGSWSEWSDDEARPGATGYEP